MRGSRAALNADSVCVFKWGRPATKSAQMLAEDDEAGERWITQGDATGRMRG
jgi:hypothetical protein